MNNQYIYYLQQISTTKSECTKFQISHDILTLEDNALLELAQCLDKISSVLQTYIDLSSDVCPT